MDLRNKSNMSFVVYVAKTHTQFIKSQETQEENLLADNALCSI